PGRPEAAVVSAVSAGAPAALPAADAPAEEGPPAAAASPAAEVPAAAAQDAGKEGRSVFCRWGVSREFSTSSSRFRRNLFAFSPQGEGEGRSTSSVTAQP
ncbi:hypothetical protein, partial [Neglectibacter timonensis]|uniref:hypothetical protein n=1 Tax=Neglectibacter timonensis TaxID=1776382 RepID=UPI003994DE22